MLQWWWVFLIVCEIYVPYCLRSTLSAGYPRVMCVCSSKMAEVLQVCVGAMCVGVCICFSVQAFK